VKGAVGQYFPVRKPVSSSENSIFLQTEKGGLQRSGTCGQASQEPARCL
jgi:hypothetical protein